jgi:hypothetical protein
MTEFNRKAHDSFQSKRVDIVGIGYCYAGISTEEDGKTQSIILKQSPNHS